MEEWRNTAAVVSGRSLTDMNLTTRIVQAIVDARQQYRLAAEDCRRFRPGVQPPPNAGQGASLAIGAGVTRTVDALDDHKRLTRLHEVTGHVFSLCAAHIGLQGIEPWWWQSWERHHADVAGHAETALQWLHSAASHSSAVHFLVHGMLMPSSPQDVTHAWGPAAEQLLRRAIHDLAMAKAAVERMRPAIVAQYSDAWMLLLR